MKLYDLAQRYVGIKELAGSQQDHPLIQWWLSLVGFNPAEVHDEVPWCSAFLNGMCWELRLPRSKNAMARSWLKVGRPVPVEEARVGDIVVFWRDSPDSHLGHVAIYAGQEGENILCLGGNQFDGVCVAPYQKKRLLGARRIEE